MCNHKIMRLGSRYGGWYSIPALLNDQSVVYSFGIGEDITFDLRLRDARSVAIHSFDPTPRAIAHIDDNGFTGLTHHPVGLADYDGEQQWYAPADPKHVSYSALKNSGAGKITVQVKRLKTIMDDLGHDHISLLKMDIEGSEYAVVDDMMQCEIFPKQILVEVHRMQDHAPSGLIYKLRAYGYRVFKAEGDNCSFVYDEVV